MNIYNVINTRFSVLDPGKPEKLEAANAERRAKAKEKEIA
jgi:hypothetical protein